MTSALDTINLLDDGFPVDADALTVLAVVEQHASANWHRRTVVLDVTPAGFCPLHGDRLDETGDCGACFLDHDRYVQRCEDI